MSTAAPQMSGQQAYDTLFGRVYAPAFFNKLANDHQRRPKDPEEARRWIKNAGKLRMLWDAQQQQKQAAVTDRISRHEQQLDEQLAAMGLAASPVATPTITPEVIKVASELAHDPELNMASITLMAANAA